MGTVRDVSKSITRLRELDLKQIDDVSSDSRPTHNWFFPDR